MIQHVQGVHENNEIIQPNDSVHNASVSDINFYDNVDMDDGFSIPDSNENESVNMNNLSIDMSLLSTTDNDVEDEDDVGEILDDDDRTWVNDMMDDGESNATTDYLMEEQCRVEDMPPCDTYQYSEEEDEQNNNTITMHDLDYIRGAHNQFFYMQEHNNLNGGICGLAHRAAARLNSRNGYVGIKEADILLDI